MWYSYFGLEIHILLLKVIIKYWENMVQCPPYLRQNNNVLKATHPKRESLLDRYRDMGCIIVYKIF